MIPKWGREWGPARPETQCRGVADLVGPSSDGLVGDRTRSKNPLYCYSNGPSSLSPSPPLSVYRTQTHSLTHHSPPLLTVCLSVKMCLCFEKKWALSVLRGKKISVTPTRTENFHSVSLDSTLSSDSLSVEFKMKDVNLRRTLVYCFPGKRMYSCQQNNCQNSLTLTKWVTKHIVEDLIGGKSNITDTRRQARCSPTIYSSRGDLNVWEWRVKP